MKLERIYDMKINELLPIGSVVILKNGKKRVMITGIKQIEPKTNKVFDYLAVLYPEGHLGQELKFLFNQENIEKVFFRGYEDEEREEFIKKLEEFYKNEENQKSVKKEGKKSVKKSGTGKKK